ncbi:methyltransferase domain-containing protein [Paenibacillus pabuli]|uniref:methyltransferase domain-containing protein n=1 Tax=Paenibacillus pabuli TaxID=1472 RepID=UPI003241F21F
MKIAILKGKGIIAPHVTDDYFQAFKELGHDVLLVNIDQDFGIGDYQAILDFKPQFILAYGYVGITRDRNGRFLWREEGIPVICLHYDNPLFSLNDQFLNEFKEFPSFYYHFVWDNYCEKFMREAGVSNIYPIMLATNPNKFYVDTNIVTQENELAFVGSIKSVQLSTNLQHLEQQFIDYVVKQKINNFRVPLFDVCMDALSNPKFQAIHILYKDHTEVFWKNIYYPIHSRGSSIFRKHVLGSLSGVDMHVYGTQEKLNESTIVHTAVPYNELSMTYQKHAVNLNISSLQLETSVNNRVFDVFASRGFVLSDYKKDMERVFPAVWEAITFQDLNDLLIKADYYLTHKKERDELVAELNNHILEEHTYKDRAAEILNVISSYDSPRDIAQKKSSDHDQKEQYKEPMESCPICDGNDYTQLYKILGHRQFETNLHRCTACGGVFMDPQPTEEYLNWFYQNIYYSEDHRKKMGWDTEISNVTSGMLRSYEMRMDLVESFADQTRFPRGTLLDIGCSTGHFLAEAQFRYWSVQGIEISESAANEGRKKFGLNVVTGEINDDIFENESFDVVTAWDVLEHIPTPHSFMKNIKRVLKKDGLFVANTPNVNSSASFHSGSKWRHLDPPLHVILYDHISLRILMKMHGFEILKISSGPEYLGQLQIIAKKTTN